MSIRVYVLLVAFAVALLGIGATAAAVAENLTRPSVCYGVADDGTCTYEVTPLRGDRARVQINVKGQPQRDVTVDESCLRVGGQTAGCPAWLVDNDDRW